MKKIFTLFCLLLIFQGVNAQTNVWLEEAKKALAENTMQRRETARSLNERRKQLENQYGVRLPSYSELFAVLDVWENFRDVNYEVYRHAVESLGYKLEDEQHEEHYLEIFRNDKEFYISLYDDLQGLATSVWFEIPNASVEVIDLYKEELGKLYRKYNKANCSENEVMGNLSGKYVDNGNARYDLEINEDGRFQVSVNDNKGKNKFYGRDTGVWYAETLTDRAVKVTPMSFGADFWLDKGDKYSISAHYFDNGFIKPDPGKDSTSSYENYSFDRRFGYRSIMGNTGGDSFEITEEAQIRTADDNGKINVWINDNHRVGNGSYAIVILDKIKK